MLVKQNFTEDYRIMTFKLTGIESATVGFAIKREIDRLQEYILVNKDYTYRNQDIANLKMLRSMYQDLHDYTIKP